MYHHYRQVVCADGFKMSVQANAATYCTPRVNGATEYTAVEVGFPSHVEPLLLSYAEEPHDLTETIYPYVPVAIVSEVIRLHGGLVEGDTPPGVMTSDMIIL